MNCDVQAYTDCKMVMEEVPYKSYDMVKGTYFAKTCTESTEIVQHTKTAPDCKYVVFLATLQIVNLIQDNNHIFLFSL